MEMNRKQAWRLGVRVRKQVLVSLPDPLPPKTLAESAEHFLTTPEADLPELAVTHPLAARPELSALLCRRSRELAGQDPRQAERVARLALVLAEQAPGWPFPTLAADARAEALAHLANALRAQEQLTEAGGLWPQVAAALQAGTQDPVLAGRLASLEASFLRASRQLALALRAGSRGLRLLRKAGQGHEAGLLALKLATIAYEQSRIDLAWRFQSLGSGLLGDDVTPLQDLGIVHNSLVLLIERGEAAQAAWFLHQARPFYQTFGTDSLRDQLAWLEARLAMQVQAWDEAMELATVARGRYAARGLRFLSALAGLDLALAQAHRQRWLKVEEVVLEILPVFEEFDVPAEAMAGLALLVKALERGRWQVGQVLEVYRQFEAVRRFPPPAKAA